MFQKLYHHLEQINTNTKQQQTHLEQAGAWAQKISNQLEALNTSILSLENQRLNLEKQRPNRATQSVGLAIAGVGFALFIVLAIYTFRLSAATAATRETSLKAYGIVNSHYEELNNNASALETKTAKLDSLVRQQARTIEELRKLNTTAIRTIFYLQRDLYQTRRQEQEQALAR